MRWAVSFLILLLACKKANAQADSSGTGPVHSTKVYEFVDQNPEFPGGDAALIRFMQFHIAYPALERDNNIEGKVIVRFIVMEDGSIDSARITKSVSKGLDKEALRVVKMLPAFKPGMHQGKPARVYYNLPVVYKLSNTSAHASSKLEVAVIEKANKDVAFAEAARLYNAGNYERSLSYLLKSIKKFPNDYLAYELKADIESKTGNSEESCKDYQIALSKGSESAAEAIDKNCK